MNNWKENFELEVEKHLISNINKYPPYCIWCGVCHNELCSNVESIEYFPDGKIKEVKFKDGSSRSRGRDDILGKLITKEDGFNAAE